MWHPPGNHPCPAAREMKNIIMAVWSALMLALAIWIAALVLKTTKVRGSGRGASAGGPAGAGRQLEPALLPPVPTAPAPSQALPHPPPPPQPLLTERVVLPADRHNSSY